MTTIESIVKTLLVTNVAKMPPDSLESADYKPGSFFKVFAKPKSGSGISKGDVLVIEAELYGSDSSVEVPIVAGEWSPVVFRAIEAFNERIGYGDTVRAGERYFDVSDSNYYVCNENVKEYQPTGTYAVGDYSVFHDTVYKCTTAVESPEEFDENKWSEIADIAGMVSEGILTLKDISKVDLFIAPTLTP